MTVLQQAAPSGWQMFLSEFSFVCVCVTGSASKHVTTPMLLSDPEL